MQFGQDFEKIFFRLSLEKVKYLQAIKYNFYTSEEIDALSYLANKFYSKFNETPTKENIKLLVQNHPKSKERVSETIIDMVFDVDLDKYDEEWLTTTAEAWIKWRTFNTSLTDTIEFIKTTEVTPENVESIVTKVKGLINDRNNLSFNSDLGLDFFNFDSHDQKENEKVSTGYNFLDRMLGGGYDKGGNLVVYAGEQNIGKSIYLANDAANFVKMGTNTVVITAEMAAHKFVKRIGSNLLNININEYAEKAKNRDHIKRRLETVGDGFTPPGSLYVKQFPTSQATVLDIEAYVAQIEEELQIKVGAVVIDYINILANYRNQNTENTYMKIKQIAEDLRAMGMRNNWLIVTATQINRNGYNSSDIGMGDIAESAGLSHTADVMLGIIQDDLMRANQEYWLKVLKIRDGEGKGNKCKLNIDFNHMRLVETEDIATSSIHGI
jgi:archaellum biogenesis ATPase FlaH|tara:strand:- start:11429 stop:12745 length:1317 start_codon:yes stop_codon:yes gene_type:complete